MVLEKCKNKEIVTLEEVQSNFTSVTIVDEYRL